MNEIEQLKLIVNRLEKEIDDLKARVETLEGKGKSSQANDAGKATREGKVKVVVLELMQAFRRNHGRPPDTARELVKFASENAVTGYEGFHAYGRMLAWGSGSHEEVCWRRSFNEAFNGMDEIKSMAQETFDQFMADYEIRKVYEELTV
ncbi:hypothetical protein VSS37_05995 [Candidatus Thiothrix sp. Deng01]|uniref:Uncharacterized protein n=1 Tax=Candidatus Thiothrix phosphatis TaxID=3112415 RepID=A0ABU6CWM9_9GAMM|nr:hypothetical protein [Candidatus Thiothrix sp. Deng01]MEB4590524.1 hypothetical protein [Candidatus Thiothrix sp. Deng01]